MAFGAAFFVFGSLRGVSFSVGGLCLFGSVWPFSDLGPSHFDFHPARYLPVLTMSPLFAHLALTLCADAGYTCPDRCQMSKRRAPFLQADCNDVFLRAAGDQKKESLLF